MCCVLMGLRATALRVPAAKPPAVGTCPALVGAFSYLVAGYSGVVFLPTFHSLPSCFAFLCDCQLLIVPWSVAAHSPPPAVPFPAPERQVSHHQRGP